MFRAVNQNPTDADIEGIIQEWDKEQTGKFNLATYFRLMDSPSVKVSSYFRGLTSDEGKLATYSWTHQQ